VHIYRQDVVIVTPYRTTGVLVLMKRESTCGLDIVGTEATLANHSISSPTNLLLESLPLVGTSYYQTKYVS